MFLDRTCADTLINSAVRVCSVVSGNTKYDPESP